MSFQPEGDYLFTVFLGACNVPVQRFQDLRLLDKLFSARDGIAGSGSGELVDRDAVTKRSVCRLVIIPNLWEKVFLLPLAWCFVNIHPYLLDFILPRFNTVLHSPEQAFG